ncbi:ABC transporter permease [Desulfobotulus mexicanus]|uniref:Transport permease protein n=1 Tax=Desulfobotulus mexicanus TaxID=2586642 RepID=A0A5Q4VG02_9BACT|nr:ABC transporter permease [Desulfobotulus mexicanus]TYT75297.1 ABC transporter permease [Desulfobotulus mexicanus]
MEIPPYSKWVPKFPWAYSFFILSSIRNEIKIRFARSRFGGIWLILNPLAQVAIFAFILSAVLSAKLPGIDNRYAYAIYLTAGILAWNLFTEIVNRCLTLFIDNANLMKKVAFPRIVLPLIVMGSAIFNNFLLFMAILFIFAFLGHMPTLYILWLPFLMVLTVLFATGTGLILGILNVFIRDLNQVVPIALQLLFWFTPIVYPAEIIPEKLQPWLHFNPLFTITEAYHSILVYQRAPQTGGILLLCIFTCLTLVAALFLFRKASREMVDVL